METDEVMRIAHGIDENIRIAKESLEDTSIRNSVNEADAILKRKKAIQNVIKLIDTEDKAKVYPLIDYILTHRRFNTNQDDINKLKRAVVMSRTLTRKMKTAVKNQNGCEINFNSDCDEHLIIGNQTYDYEDD